MTGHAFEHLIVALIASYTCTHTHRHVSTCCIMPHVHVHKRGVKVCVCERERRRERERERVKDIDRQTLTDRKAIVHVIWTKRVCVCVRERERNIPIPLPRRLITLSCLYFIANSRGVSSTGEGVRGRSGALSDNSILQQST